MKTLQIDEKSARKFYPSATPEFKQALEDTFGKAYFSDKITDRVKSWEDVCEIKGIHPHQSLPYPDPVNDRQTAVNAYFKIDLIREVLNEGWEPNWNDSSEYKYYPWFNHSGGGFSFGSYGCVFALSFVGARLSFKSKELAIYAGKQFLDIYKAFHTL